METEIEKIHSIHNRDDNEDNSSREDLDRETETGTHEIVKIYFRFVV